ncbi:hypothetical protein [Paenibacillus nasutitermitis]|nr:hypothetical protein [Paenibacillus nasutitermitis]
MTCFCACFLAILGVFSLNETAEARALDLLSGGEKSTEQNSGDTAFFDALKTLPSVGGTTVDALGAVVDSTVQTALPAVLNSAADSLDTVVDSTVKTALPAVLESAADSLDTVVDSTVKTALPAVLDSAVDSLDTVVDSAVKTALPAVLNSAADSLDTVVDSTVKTALPAVLNSAADSLDTVVDSTVKTALPAVLDSAVDSLDTVVDSTVKTALPAVLESTVDSLDTVVDSTVKTALPAVLESTVDGLGKILLPAVKPVIPGNTKPPWMPIDVAGPSPESPRENAPEISSALPDLDAPVGVEAHVQLVESRPGGTSPAPHAAEPRIEAQLLPLELVAEVEQSSSENPVPPDSVSEDRNGSGLALSVPSQDTEYQNAEGPAFVRKIKVGTMQIAPSDRENRRLKPDKPVRSHKREIPLYPNITAAASPSQPAPSPTGTGGGSVHPLNQMVGVLADSLIIQSGSQRIFAKDTKLFIPNRANEPPIQPPQHILFSLFML